MATSHPSSSSSSSLTISDNGQESTIEFTRDDPNILRAEKDDDLFWSTIHKELSHPNLFERADNTRSRLLPDIEHTFYELSDSKRRKLMNGFQTLSDPEPAERLKLRLAGHVQAGTNQIIMSDSVWIRCSDSYSVRVIKDTLERMEWLTSTEYAPVYVYIDS